jgi:hypothetical protein
MFGWFKRKKRGEIALTIMHGDQKREVSVRELAIGNKLAGDALLSVLADKGLVNIAEIQAKIRQLGQQNWRVMTGGQAGPAADESAGEPDADHAALRPDSGPERSGKDPS